MAIWDFLSTFWSVGYWSVQKHELLTFELEMARQVWVFLLLPRKTFAQCLAEQTLLGSLQCRACVTSVKQPKPMCLLLKHNWLINLHLQVDVGKYFSVAMFFHLRKFPSAKSSLDWQPRKGKALVKAGTLKPMGALQMQFLFLQVSI